MRLDDEGNIHYQGEFETYEGRFLPHWDVEDGIYFVTFRLADSLPREVRRRMSDHYTDRVRHFTETMEPDPRELAQYAFSLYREDIDPVMDSGYGACHLRRPDVAKVVRDSLLHFDGERYELFVWVIMPNHVHVVFRRRPEYSLKRVVGGWKSFTAHELRGVVDYEEHFWQADYYDHLIRTEQEFRNTCRYVWRNPENAGLEDWGWRGIERSG